MGITEDGKLGVGAGKQPEELDEWLAKVRREWSDTFNQ
jgi:hypothetical protein